MSQRGIPDLSSLLEGRRLLQNLASKYQDKSKELGLNSFDTYFSKAIDSSKSMLMHAKKGLSLGQAYVPSVLKKFTVTIQDYFKTPEMVPLAKAGIPQTTPLKATSKASLQTSLNEEVASKPIDDILEGLKIDSQDLKKIKSSIKKASEKYDVPESLIASVIKSESNFKVHAKSHAGAKGLMQLMPATAKELGVKDVFDIDQNIEGGTKYLRQMLDRFDQDKTLALAAYNAGPGNVKRYGGVPPFKETKKYVSRVLKHYDALV